MSINKLECAMCLAKGSFGTARDLGILLVNDNPELADEFKHLASNFQRIAELLEESMQPAKDTLAAESQQVALGIGKDFT